MPRKRHPTLGKIRASSLSDKALMDRFASAAEAFINKGRDMPEDYAEIDREYAFYRTELKRRLTLASLVNVELKKS